ncbi:MAG: hypothetical protein IPJ20_11055 [Flammeovirgaceae bacterium]|nr:hypothetical protein [Flammeovirgaceae bacterium]
MKILKKVLVGLGVLLVLVVAAAFILPIVFKDDIKAAIDKEIAKNINADVLFDVDKFSLTIFKNFPNITAEVKDLGVFNRAPFEGVPLFVVGEVDVELNLKDILFGDQLRIKGVSMIRPQITIKVLKDGRANYDITFPSTDSVTVTTEESGSFSFGIDNWQITDGHLIYDDQTLPFSTTLHGLNHSGSGDFNEKEFDLTTNSVVDSLTVVYDGVEYLTNKRAEFDAIIGIGENYSRYTFKENTTKINDFVMSAEGWFKMNDDNYDMDLAFKSSENSFKSLLSLVPGIYTKDFGNIETKGDLSFTGFAKGIYSDTQMPAFNMALTVNNAMFKYPDLPTAISNIAMDLLIDNKTGIIENTVVDLKKLHLDFGSNPVDARLLIENLKDYRMNGNLKASLNLNELSQMFPMEGLEMKGLFTINASAKGVYDSLKKIIPTIDASMALSKGFIKSSEFPLPLEDLQFSTSINNASGNMAETIIAVKDFNMLMDGEKFTADLKLQNLNDYTWDAKVNGGIDLEKITKIFPLEGMKLAGKVKANIETKGKYSDLEASRYDRLPTSGSASLKDFKYSASDLPYVVTMSQSEAIFDPQKIELKNTTGTIGKSDFALTGAINNYIGYLFGSNETIRGNLTFNSTFLDLNEFMTETEEATPSTDSVSLGVLEVPQNINFLLHANVKTTKLMDYTITNALGDVIVKDGVANLSGIKFNMLGGTFTVNGSYNTQNLEHPLYDMALKIESLSIQQAASSFSIVQTYAPIAGLVNGNFGTDFQISGELGQDMMPKMNTINAGGLIKIAQAALTQSKLISSVTSLTKLDDADNVTLKDVLMSATIREGRLSVKPFDVKFGNYVTNVSGSTGLDGSIAYQLKMNVPAGKLGAQMQGFINQYAGTTNPTSEIPVTIGLGGTYNDPKPTLLMQEQKQQAKEAVTAVAEEKGKQAAQDVLAGKKPEEAINNLFKKDTTKTAATSNDSTKTDLKQETQKVLEDKLQKLLKKKKKN